MRYFHKQQNHFWKPIINLDKVHISHPTANFLTLPGATQFITACSRKSTRKRQIFTTKTSGELAVKLCCNCEWSACARNHRMLTGLLYSCGPSSLPRLAMPTFPEPRRTPSPSSTSCPLVTPRSLARAACQRSPWSYARDGSASWLRRRSRRLVVLSSWLLKLEDALP